MAEHGVGDDHETLGDTVHGNTPLTYYDTIDTNASDGYNPIDASPGFRCNGAPSGYTYLNEKANRVIYTVNELLENRKASQRDDTALANPNLASACTSRMATATRPRRSGSRTRPTAAGPPTGLRAGHSTGTLYRYRCSDLPRRTRHPAVDLAGMYRTRRYSNRARIRVEWVEMFRGSNGDESRVLDDGIPDSVRDADSDITMEDSTT